MRRTVAALAGLLLIGCVYGHDFTWAQVETLRVGMTEQEVIAIMGQPNSITVLPSPTSVVTTTVTGSSGTVTTSTLGHGEQELLVWVRAQVYGSMRHVQLPFENGRLVGVPRVPGGTQDSQGAGGMASEQGSPH